MSDYTDRITSVAANRTVSRHRRRHLRECIAEDTLVSEIRQTVQYRDWFDGLDDRRARAQVLARVRRLSLGNGGDCVSVGGGVLEMRIHYGPGYRIYFVVGRGDVIILLAGGDKSRQQRDIRRARELADQLDERSEQ